MKVRIAEGETTLPATQALENSVAVELKVKECADDLQRVTDGHAAGDAVLKVVALRLLSHARDEDTVCRNGGDEFLYLLINPAGRDNVARIAGLVRTAIAHPIGLGPLQFEITPSFGIAIYPDHGTSGDVLVAHADAAMYRAKQLRTACEFFEPPVTPSASTAS